MTLFEITVVLALMVVVAGAVAGRLSGVMDLGQNSTTAAAMDALRAGIMGRAGATPPCGYLADVQAMPSRIPDLLKQGAEPSFDPVTGLGWRGPYCANSTALDTTTKPPPAWLAPYWTEGDPVFLDGWSNPIVIQFPDTEGLYSRLVSAGPDGELQTPGDVNDPPMSICGDDRVLYLRVADPRPLDP